MIEAKFTAAESSPPREVVPLPPLKMLATAVDHHDMTPRRWFSGLSIALLVGAVGIAPAVRAQTAMPQQPARGADTAADHPVSHHPDLAGPDHAASTALDENMGATGPANRPKATRPPRAGAGPVRVTVPATVVVRVDRRGAVTAAMSNTGRPPQPGDDLWVARTGHPDIEPAPPALVLAVMAQPWPGNWKKPGIWHRAVTAPDENP